MTSALFSKASRAREVSAGNNTWQRAHCYHTGDTWWRSLFASKSLDASPAQTTQQGFYVGFVILLGKRDPVFFVSMVILIRHRHCTRMISSRSLCTLVRRRRENWSCHWALGKCKRLLCEGRSRSGLQNTNEHLSVPSLYHSSWCRHTKSLDLPGLSAR